MSSFNIVLISLLCREGISSSISNKIYREYSPESRVISLKSPNLNIGKKINVLSKPTGPFCSLLKDYKVISELN